MPHTIRRANEGDIPALLDLLLQVNLVHHNARPDLFRGPTTKYDADGLRLLLRDPARPVFVCVDDSGAVLGHAFCIHRQEVADRILTDVRTLYIDDICVSEAHRHRHVGTDLFDAVRAYARANHFYNITLNVWSLNPSAAAFYERLGFAPQKIGMELKV